MKIVADENITRLMVRNLRAAGHKGRCILEEERGKNDQEILPLAISEGALLLTWDKDFRQLAIEAHRPSAGVLLLRMGNLGLREQSEKVVQIITQYNERLHHFFTTVYPDRIEMEPLEAGS